MLKKRTGTDTGSITNTNPRDPNVRLIEPSLRQPATATERLAVAALRQGSTTSLSSLVNHVAREIYNQEVANGAWALDIGIFGPDLFAPDVALELRAGNRILWDIENSA